LIVQAAAISLLIIAGCRGTEPAGKPQEVGDHAYAEITTPPGPDPNTVERILGAFSVKDLPEFQPVAPVLMRLLEAESKQSGTNVVSSQNHFYVCPIQKALLWNGGVIYSSLVLGPPQVYWKERQALIAWETEGNPSSDKTPEERDKRESFMWSLAHSRRFLVRGRDTIPTGNDLHGSTFEVFLRDFDRQVQDCVATGELFVTP
jgi:hypothetical protein